ncbi:type II toxin-antitoxin system PemK/MazF family toxin [Myceligenerans pegani]|uniref:mRNA interferase n=1 Tax=Myceligenerans pegani TaxID=2776917 RepID=A0ABR9N3H9_9MICO|nr:type II toxin-antitoxin system PemK/MazF family toxin [Myceligenerans sp. TRM 65318]MBE1877658.1 type II toxin-antitoxin system PemK/MazF family toxin [Myceligenerans sp. TRM 65318]MBE3019929.1 type II toxin-antitoxin system PemK/MazF family toxin [Myceligenerans sp. TRM 65318]
MRRGDVWFADLDPARGSEANKVRPVVIVSNDARNRSADRSARGVLTVVPLTSNTARVLPFQALVPAGAATGLDTDSKAQAEQVRSIDMGRLTRRAGALSAETMAVLDEALMLHLGLD